MKKLFPSIAFLILWAAAPAFAARDEHIAANTLESFQTNAEDVRGEMRVSGRFGGIAPRDREKVEVELQRMESMLSQYGSVEAMDPRTKGELFNAQERANALLAGNDDQRLICQMVEPTGSKMRKRECRRAGDVRRTRDAQRDGLRNNDHIDHGPTG